jgi:hypothetical protein
LRAHIAKAIRQHEATLVSETVKSKRGQARIRDGSATFELGRELAGNSACPTEVGLRGSLTSVRKFNEPTPPIAAS